MIGILHYTPVVVREDMRVFESGERNLWVSFPWDIQRLWRLDLSPWAGGGGCLSPGCMNREGIIKAPTVMNCPSLHALYKCTRYILVGKFDRRLAWMTGSPLGRRWGIWTAELEAATLWTNRRCWSKLTQSKTRMQLNKDRKQNPKM